MSWVVREGPISPRLRGDVPLQHASHSSTIGAVKSSASHRQPDEAVDEPTYETTMINSPEGIAASSVVGTVAYWA